MSPSSSQPVVRILILETDEAHPSDQHEKGSYADILHQHFTKAGEAHDPPLGIETDTRFVVTDKGGKVPRPEEFDGFDGALITGSMYDAHGDDEWIAELEGVLKDVWQRYPMFHFSGVCFGHQLLARLLGCKVAPAPTEDWELGHSKIDLSPIGQKLFRTEESHIHLHQMHQDQVVHPPSSSTTDLLSPDQTVHVWGSSPHTAVQGLYIENRIFTTQAHVGFDEDMVKREIEMRVEKGAIDEDEHGETVEKAEDTAHLEHDGEVVAAAILRFFHYEDDGLE